MANRPKVTLSALKKYLRRVHGTLGIKQKYLSVHSTALKCHCNTAQNDLNKNEQLDGRPTVQCTLYIHSYKYLNKIAMESKYRKEV